MKYSMDPSLLIVLDTKQLRKLNLFFTESSVLLDDSPLKMFELFEKEFSIFEYRRMYSYDVPDWQTKDGVSLKDREYASIYLRSENSTRVYTRRTYDLLGYLGDLGGI